MNIPKDLQRKIALELKPYDLINFCLTEKQIYKNVCDSNEFWRLKLSIDYPEVFNYYSKNNMILRNPKNTYIKQFTQRTKEFEKFLENKNIKNIEAVKELLNIYILYNKSLTNRINMKNYEVYSKSVREFIIKYWGFYITEIKSNLEIIFDSLNRKNEIYKKI